MNDHLSYINTYTRTANPGSPPIKRLDIHRQTLPIRSKSRASNLTSGRRECPKRFFTLNPRLTMSLDDRGREKRWVHCRFLRRSKTSAFIKIYYSSRPLPMRDRGQSTNVHTYRHHSLFRSCCPFVLWPSPRRIETRAQTAPNTRFYSAHEPLVLPFT